MYQLIGNLRLLKISMIFIDYFNYFIIFYILLMQFKTFLIDFS